MVAVRTRVTYVLVALALVLPAFASSATVESFAANPSEPVVGDRNKLTQAMVAGEGGALPSKFIMHPNSFYLPGTEPTAWPGGAMQGGYRVEDDGGCFDAETPLNEVHGSFSPDDGLAFWEDPLVPLGGTGGWTGPPFPIIATFDSGGVGCQPGPIVAPDPTAISKPEGADDANITAIFGTPDPDEFAIFTTGDADDVMADNQGLDVTTRVPGTTLPPPAAEVTVLYRESFAEDDGGWIAGDPSGEVVDPLLGLPLAPVPNQWRWVNGTIPAGTLPVGTAMAAQDDYNYWYVGLDTPAPAYFYGDMSDTSVRSPDIDLTSASNPVLTIHVGGSSESNPACVNCDKITVRVVDAASAATFVNVPVANDFVGHVAPDYQELTANLAPLAGKTVYIEATFTSDDYTAEGQGWSIDNVTITDTGGGGGGGGGEPSEPASTNWLSVMNGAFDPVSLNVTVTPDAGQDCVALSVQFLSEDYPFMAADPTYRSYTDIFLAQLNPDVEAGWSINGANNLAGAQNNIARFVDSGRLVTATTPELGMLAERANGTAYGGGSRLFEVRGHVTPGAANYLHLTLLERGDGWVDSAVFMDNLRTFTANETDPYLTCPDGIWLPPRFDVALDGPYVTGIDQVFTATAEVALPAGLSPDLANHPVTCAWSTPSWSGLGNATARFNVTTLPKEFDADNMTVVLENQTLDQRCSTKMAFASGGLYTLRVDAFDTNVTDGTDLPGGHPGETDFDPGEALANVYVVQAQALVDLPARPSKGGCSDGYASCHTWYEQVLPPSSICLSWDTCQYTFDVFRDRDFTIHGRSASPALSTMPGVSQVSCKWTVPEDTQIELPLSCDPTMRFGTVGEHTVTLTLEYRRYVTATAYMVATDELDVSITVIPDPSTDSAGGSSGSDLSGTGVNEQLAEQDSDLPTKDNVKDPVDNCPGATNADQSDLDGDGVGDVCDSDRDGDGRPNGGDACPDAASAGTDTDRDGLDDACDEDDDADLVLDEAAGIPTDNCRMEANPDQRNLDGDSEGDACDGDDDNDGVPDLMDAAPLDGTITELVAGALLPIEERTRPVGASNLDEDPYTPHNPGLKIYAPLVGFGVAVLVVAILAFTGKRKGL